MQFKQGAVVQTADGRTIGRLDRVVVDPRTKEVNYVVVRKGTLFTQDKVVPLTLVARADADEIVLREDAGELEDLPNFDERYYVPAEDNVGAPMGEPGFAPQLYAYPPVLGGNLGTMGAGFGTAAPQQMGAMTVGPGVVEHRERPIPDDNVALRAGARVIAADGDSLGRVEQVLTGSGTDEVSHFVVSEGLLFKDRKLIPISWVSQISEDEVHLAVDSRFVSKLEEYNSE